MLYRSDEMETRAVLDTAARICAAARTAPKAKGVDRLETLVVTGEDKDRLADAMRALSEEYDYAFCLRDAGNVDASNAVVLFGMRETQRGLGAGCAYCHYKDCADCKAHEGLCAWDAIDLGIALGSAVATASDARIDNRLMFSIGRAALKSGVMGEGVTLIVGLPLSVSGKSPFFDRKPKK